MDQVFGDSHRIFWLEYGMTLFELTEFTVASGLYKDPGHRIDAAGNQSADDDTMQAVPFSVDATFRLDVLPEQPIVPFAGFGYDYWLWEESWNPGWPLLPRCVSHVCRVIFRTHMMWNGPCPHLR